MIYFCNVPLILPAESASRIIFISSLYLLFVVPSFGQTDFAKSLTVGSSFTYIFNREEVDPSIFSTHQEFTWNVNVGLEVLPKWQLGFMYLNIHTISEINSIRKQQHNIFSIFNQYNFYTSEKKWRLFAELIYSYGNYCTCGLDDPYKESALSYLGFGGGMELPIYKRLFLDLAFNTNSILNDIPLKYNFTQYVIGLNYKLGGEYKSDR